MGLVTGELEEYALMGSVAASEVRGDALLNVNQ